jgi:hypothetical protein
MKQKNEKLHGTFTIKSFEIKLRNLPSQRPDSKAWGSKVPDSKVQGSKVRGKVRDSKAWGSKVRDSKAWGSKVWGSKAWDSSSCWNLEFRGEGGFGKVVSTRLH